jgi:hypothetical protein
VLLLCAPVWAANSYYTTFPATENPISEGGLWINGGTTGLLWKDVRTTPGFAFGTQLGSETCPSNCNDSTAVLTGTWGANQTVQFTAGVPTPSTTVFEELELRLRTTITANSITGYEVNCSVVNGGNGNYIQIIKWLGGLGLFTQLNGNTDRCNNGDTYKATITGTSSTVITVFHNGTNVMSVTDSSTPWTSGDPGIGMFVQGGTGLDANFGMSNFAASDGVAALATTAASSITSTTASAGGNIILDGGASVTARGTCYATSSNPTTPCTSDGSGTGVFTSSLSGLSPGTLYHARAFGTNTNGTGYGSDSTFTTPGSAVSGGGVCSGPCSVFR